MAVAWWVLQMGTDRGYPTRSVFETLRGATVAEGLPSKLSGEYGHNLERLFGSTAHRRYRNPGRKAIVGYRGNLQAHTFRMVVEMVCRWCLETFGLNPSGHY